MTKLSIACVALVAGSLWSPAFARPECRLLEADRKIAVELARFGASGQEAAAEEAARLLVPSPCETSPAPRLALDTVALGLLAAEWRQGTEALERSRWKR